MKKRLLNPTLFFLSFFLLTSGMVFGQEKIQIFEKNNNSKVAKLTSQKVSKEAALMGTVGNDITKKEPINNTLSIYKTREVKAGPFTTPYYDGFDEIPSGVSSWEELLPALGWTTFSSGTGRDFLAYPVGGNQGSVVAMLSPYDLSNARNEWAITPGITLEAFQEYKIEFYAQLPEHLAKQEFKVMMGSAATIAAMTTEVLDYTGSNAISTEADEWVKIEGTFSVILGGTYYFGLNITTGAGGDRALFDDFVVAKPDYRRIYGGMAYQGGLWSKSTKYTSPTVFLAENDGLAFIHSLYEADAFTWSFGSNATPSTSTDTAAVTVYSGASDFTATTSLTASNSSSATYDISTSFDVLRPQNNTADPEIVGNIKPYEAGGIELIANYQLMAGPTQYWTRIGEAYFLPDDVSISLEEVLFLIPASNIPSSKLTLNVPVKIYNINSQTGNLELNQEFTANYQAIFGASPIEEETAGGLTFPTPVEITGSFFIEFDFTTFGTPSATAGYCGFSMVTRDISDCTFYVNYQNGWYPINAILSGQYIYMSSAIFPVLKFIADPSGIENNTADNNIKVSVDNGTITVTGAEGLPVSLVTIDGRQVYSTIASDDVTIPSVAQGIYVVKAGQKSIKVMVK